MRLQLADPAEHPDVGLLPFSVDLEEWAIPDIHPVIGLHRHVVRLVEVGRGSKRASYVVKEMPDHLVQREYRLLRGLAEDRLPTAVVVAAITERAGQRDGLLVTRHLDYALPYRSLLSGRGLHIPYLGDRLLDALVGLLVRLHLAGFFWGDCSLSNTLFRRDAGALSAYIIDTETSERYDSLSDGQRTLDLDIATENVAGGLLDLQVGGRLVPDIDPWDIAERIETSYADLWRELKAWEEFSSDEAWRIEQRLERLHRLGFDVAEMDLVADEAAHRVRIAPRVVESGYHQDRLMSLTGLWAGENQARRLLGDIRNFGAEMQAATGVALPENIVAVRWLDQRFEPTVSAIPRELLGKLQAAEVYHQYLEHRWLMSEREGRDVPRDEAFQSYVDEILREAPDEQVRLDQTAELLLDVDARPES
jgi:Domain of unknown function (DUF4032)/Lipopolysaccharide kinase (Kdo/WaaP) family